MNFEYNENACTVIIDFYKKRIESIEKELKALRVQQGLTDDHAVYHALAEIINQQESDKSATDMKIKEMENQLQNFGHQP